MKVEADAYGESLTINGFECHYVDESCFELPWELVEGGMLSDIPLGYSIELSERVVGSRDLAGRTPHCRFERTPDGEFLIHLETVAIPERDVAPEHSRGEVERLMEGLRAKVNELAMTQKIAGTRESIRDEIGYLTVSLRMSDRPILEAESFVARIEERLMEWNSPSLLFICHASEDTRFVRRLSKELKRRAFNAWYDKEEILVGESIVGRINQAMDEAEFVLAVLSPHSVKKAWVTREINSSLMRQLQGANIRLLPLLKADCEFPPLLADIKYANFTRSFEQGLSELMAGITRRH